MKRGGAYFIRDFERDAVLEAEGGLKIWTRGAVVLREDGRADLVEKAAGGLMMAGRTWARGDGAVARTELGNDAPIMDLPQARRYEAELRAIKEGRSHAEAARLYAGEPTSAWVASTPVAPQQPAAVASAPSVLPAMPAVSPAPASQVSPLPAAMPPASPPTLSSGVRLSPAVAKTEEAAGGNTLWRYAFIATALGALKAALKGRRKRRGRTAKKAADLPLQGHRHGPSALPEGSPAVQESRASRGFRDLTWDEFEILVGEIYRRQGYSVEISGGDGADGGVDLVLRKGEERVLVQCKNWNSSKVGVSEIREFFGVVIAEFATRGIFVSAGEYTRDALEFAAGKPIEIINGQGLSALIAQAQNDPGDDLLDVALWAPVFAQAVRVVKPSCPFCRSAMVRRHGEHSDFWGCSTFPKCRGKREARKYLAEFARG